MLHKPIFWDSLPGNLKGMAFALISGMTFASISGMVRHVSADIHPFEIAFFRFFFGFIVLLPVLMRTGLAPLKTNRLGMHLVRVVLGAFATLAIFYALSVTPLAQVAALGFTMPIFATVLAMIIFREIVGIRRWAAIAVGFLGTYVILRPGAGTIELGALLVLFSSVLYGISVILIKSLTRTDTPLTITAFQICMMSPVLLVPALFVWEWPTWPQLAWLAAIGIVAAFSVMSFAMAMKEADTVTVMSLNFLQLLWASLIGFAFFAEIPDLFTWIGGAMIVASTTYIAYRERVAGRSLKVVSTTPAPT
jgi:drug/metabolite transporter (DMT)-like permease